jgi:hypothetical protein
MKMPRFLPASGSPLERFLRAMALMAVFAGVLWAFEARFSRLADRLAQEQTVFDATGTLTDEQRRFLRQAGDDLKARFGMGLVVRVGHGPVEVPPLDEKTVFLGLSVGEKSARAVLPPLAAAALGPESGQVVERDILGASLADGRWPEGLCAAVIYLEQQLSGLSRTGDAS